MTTTAHTTAPHQPAEDPSHLFSRPVVALVVAAAILIIGTWLVFTPPGVTGKANAIGYAICHRIAERSFFAHDHQQPLCARCTGIYLGVLSGLGFFVARGRLRTARLPRVRVLAVLLGMGAVYAVDGLNSYLSLFDFYTPVYAPHNTLRLLTGTAFGLGLITVVWPVFNSILWRQPSPVAPLESLKELGGMVLVGGGVSALVLLPLDSLRLVLGLVSVVGVVLMFAIIGAVTFLIVVRRDNRLTHGRDLLIPALAGLAFAICVIGIIDLGRYVLTGTWDGFTLPT